MAFDLDTWRSQIAERWRKFRTEGTQALNEVGATTAFGFCIGATLAPPIEAFLSGEAVPALAAMSEVVGTVGAGLWAIIIDRWWTRKGDPEKELATEPELRPLLDALLTKLDVVHTAQEALGEEWESIQRDMTDSAERAGFTAFIESLQITTTGDVHVHIVGNVYVEVYSAPPGRQELSESDFQKLRSKYLELVSREHGAVQLHGLHTLQGSAPLPKRLDAVYTSLRASWHPKTMDEKAQDGRTRDLRQKAARGEEATEKVDMRHLLTLSDRIMIVGGAGSGKTTYLSFLASSLAKAHMHGGLVDSRIRSGKPDRPLPLPIMVPLRYWNVYRQWVRERPERGLDDPRSAGLAGFLPWYLQSRYHALGPPRDFFDRMLEAKGCLLLLDGIDEVVSSEERLVLRDAVRHFVEVEYPGNQCIVTGRSGGFRDVPFGEDFCRCDILPMDEGKIGRLVRAWCEQLYPQAQDCAAAEADIRSATRSLNEERGEKGQEPLVSTPLLVTMVVAVKYSRKELPQERAKLYDACVDVVLHSLHTGEEDELGARKAVVYDGGPPDKQREWLTELAFHMHGRGQDQGGATIDGEGICAFLGPKLAARGEPSGRLGRFLGAIRKRGGLLEARGDRFEFMHLTFQEFLAGEHLAGLDPSDEGTAALLAEIASLEWWREPVLLAIGSLGPPRRYDSREAFVRGLCTLKAPWHAVLPAAEFAATGLLELTDAEDALLHLAASRLREILQGRRYLQAAEPMARARAGRAINLLPGGDVRRGVGLRPDRADIPDIQWCSVPGGTLMMGSTKDEEDASEDEYGPGGKPFEVKIDPFRLAAYPVTNVQFRPFVEGDGYENPDLWTKNGWQRKQGEKWVEPRYWPDSAWNMDNHPVVGVTWYEAAAYCRWLTARLREIGELEQEEEVRLPMEAEWEWAARGPQRYEYPWGNEWRKSACNVEETEIGRTSAVGVFPSDVSRWLADEGQAVYDLAGNVNEWCLTKWRESYAEAPDDSVEGDASRVIRGGAWVDSNTWARCASRLRASLTSGSTSSSVFVAPDSSSFAVVFCLLNSVFCFSIAKLRFAIFSWPPKAAWRPVPSPISSP